MTMQITRNPPEKTTALSLSSRRNIITANLMTALRDASQQNGCLVFGSDVKVWASGGVFTPAVSVVCGPMNYHEGDQTIYTNPVFVADVISTDIPDEDRERRLQRIWSVRSLTKYLRVSDSEVHIENLGGRWAGSWFRSEETSLSSVLGIHAISASIAVADIYRKVNFSEAEL